MLSQIIEEAYVIHSESLEESSMKEKLQKAKEVAKNISKASTFASMIPPGLVQAGYGAGKASYYANKMLKNKMKGDAQKANEYLNKAHEGVAGIVSGMSLPKRVSNTYPYLAPGVALAGTGAYMAIPDDTNIVSDAMQMKDELLGYV